MAVKTQKDKFRALLASMERRKDRNFIVQFHVGGEVKSEYDMSIPQEIDMKSPQDWLNACFFHYSMGEMGNGEFGLKIKLK